jgi:hypothetical protein
MKITKNRRQVNLMFSENTTIHIYVGYGTIMRFGILYDSWKPFRHISIVFVFFGIDIFF